MSTRVAFLVGCAFLAAACTQLDNGAAADPFPEQSNSTTTTLPPTTTTLAPTTTTAPPTTTTTTLPRFTLTGSVLDADGSPLAGAYVRVADREVTSESDGTFTVQDVPAGPVSIWLPAWHAVEMEWTGEAPLGEVVLEPRIVRALRVSSYVAADNDAFANLLDLADMSVVNALVFDTKDESGYVLYESQVPTAVELGTIRAMYDPVTALAAAKELGLYTVTRVVSFEDQVWIREDPEVKLAGRWVDSRDEANWEYPLGLAVEACELGFDEIQFDYVRFPAGKTGAAFLQREGTTQEDRVGTIQAFLEEAQSRLHPLGCAVSADIFAIVLSAPDDQGIGQRPEEVSAAVDALSPMIYPSHYSDGWLGFASPNDHPAAVTADALDDGIPRLAPNTLMRPWLQAFYYNGAQIQASIAEAEERGVGWILWNAPGNYQESWVPVAE